MYFLLHRNFLVPAICLAGGALVAFSAETPKHTTKPEPLPVHGGTSNVPILTSVSKPATPVNAFAWPAADRPAVAKVAPVNGIPRLFINGVQVPTVMFFGNTDVKARHAVIKEEFRKAGAHGIHLHSMISSPGLRRTGPNKEQYADLENDLKTVITGDPDGFILLRVNTGCYGDVSSYAASELVRFTTNRAPCRPMVSIASDLWLADAKKMLRDMVTFIRSDPTLILFPHAR